MMYHVYDTERRNCWRVIMDLDHAKGVELADTIDADERFSFLFYRERTDIGIFVISVGLSAHSSLEGEDNGYIKEELMKICHSVLGILSYRCN
ncbi:MAG: hypothetical protein ACI30A_06525 [Paludibacteraceae bacterium]